MTRADKYPAEPSASWVDSRITVLRTDYLHEILSARRTRALELVLAAHQAGYPVVDIYMNVFQEALYEIGRLWETNRISVADEHMATAITQYVMANLYQYLDVTGIQRGKFVMTGVEGELHQVGANMVADVLEADGWNVMFLGTNVPADGVIQSIREHGADLVGISSTMVCNIPKVITLVEATRAECGASVNIILGGGAFRCLQELPSELEGCVVALNLRETLELTRHKLPAV